MFWAFLGPVLEAKLQQKAKEIYYMLMLSFCRISVADLGSQGTSGSYLETPILTCSGNAKNEPIPRDSFKIIIINATDSTLH